MGISKFLEKSHIDLIVYILLSFLLFIIYFSQNFLKYLGIFISLLGFAIWVAGLIYLGDAFQIRPEARRLITGGIYSKIRHPIYVGGFIVILGWFIYSIGTMWFLVLILALIISAIIAIIRISKEEELLYKKFGKRYLKARAKAWF